MRRNNMKDNSNAAQAPISKNKAGMLGLLIYLIKFTSLTTIFILFIEWFNHYTSPLHIAAVDGLVAQQESIQVIEEQIRHVSEDQGGTDER